MELVADGIEEATVTTFEEVKDKMLMNSSNESLYCIESDNNGQDTFAGLFDMMDIPHNKY